MPEFKKRDYDLKWSWDGTNRDHGRVAKPNKPAQHTAKYTKIIENEQRGKVIKQKMPNIFLPHWGCLHGLPKMPSNGFGRKEKK